MGVAEELPTEEYLEAPLDTLYPLPPPPQLNQEGHQWGSEGRLREGGGGAEEEGINEWVCVWMVV